MRANRVFQLTVTRGSREPAFLNRRRVDRIEVSSIADSEPILYWELPAKEAASLLRRLRADLAEHPGRGVPGAVGGRRQGRVTRSQPVPS